MELYYKNLGWGPWNVYEYGPPLLHDTVLRGIPTYYTMIGAEAHVEPVDVELIQPVEGPSIYKEWLDKHGEGVHHIARMKVGSDAPDLLRQFDALGMKELMSGSIGGTIASFYLDTEPRPKFVPQSGIGNATDPTPPDSSSP